MMCASGTEHAVGNTFVPQSGSNVAGRIAKPQKAPSGKKFQQPISFSFADVMEKVIDLKLSGL